MTLEEARRHKQMQWALARQGPAPAEKALWEMVRDHRCGGLGFRRQSQIGPFRGKARLAPSAAKPDWPLPRGFLLPGKKTGRGSGRSIHQEPPVKQRDRDRQRILEQDFGLRFLRVSNDDVLKNPQETQACILAAAGEESE